MKINVSVSWKTSISNLLNGKTKNTVHSSDSCTKLCLFFFSVVSDEDLISWKRKMGKKPKQNLWKLFSVLLKDQNISRSSITHISTWPATSAETKFASIINYSGPFSLVFLKVIWMLNGGIYSCILSWLASGELRWNCDYFN